MTTTRKDEDQIQVEDLVWLKERLEEVKKLQGHGLKFLFKSPEKMALDKAIQELSRDIQKSNDNEFHLVRVAEEKQLRLKENELDKLEKREWGRVEKNTKNNDEKKLIEEIFRLKDFEKNLIESEKSEFANEYALAQQRESFFSQYAELQEKIKGTKLIEVQSKIELQTQPLRDEVKRLKERQAIVSQQAITVYAFSHGIKALENAFKQIEKIKAKNPLLEKMGGILKSAYYSFKDQIVPGINMEDKVQKFKATSVTPPIDNRKTAKRMSDYLASQKSKP